MPMPSFLSHGSTRSIAACVALGLASATSAATILEEGPATNAADPSGNFSDSLTSPTAVPPLSPGSSVVEGILYNGQLIGSASFRFDADTLAFTVPTGTTLESIVFTGSLDVGGLGGAVVTLDTVNFDLYAAGSLGSPLASFELSTGQDALAQGPLPLGSLGPGDYVLRVSESTTTFMSPADPMIYEIDYSLTPEPGTISMLAFVGFAVTRRCRSRR